LPPPSKDGKMRSVVKSKTAVEALADLVMEKRNKEMKKDFIKKEKELK